MRMGGGREGWGMILVEREREKREFPGRGGESYERVESHLGNKKTHSNLHNEAIISQASSVYVCVF